VSSVKSEPSRRPYRSAVREEGARRTRRAIVLAATTLFVERGFVAASLGDIAAAAGVARPTVTAAFGSKAALLAEVVDEALAGDDEPVPVSERPWFRPVWEARTQEELLTAYAQVCTVIGARAARPFEVLRRAAASGPEIAELWESARRNRRTGAGMVVDRIRALGPVDELPGRDHMTDVVWFFNDPAHYDTLVLQRGWTEHDFTGWLAARMQDALLHG
jgi:AcrR family transcriptional regulator